MPNKLMPMNEVSFLERFPDFKERLVDLFERVPGDDTTEGAAGIVDAILNSNTIDEMNGLFEGEGLRSYVGRILRVISVEKRVSDKRGGLPFYLLMRCVDENGEKKTLTTGAVVPTMMLCKAHAMGALPVDIQVSELPQKEDWQGTPLQIQFVKSV